MPVDRVALGFQPCWCLSCTDAEAFVRGDKLDLDAFVAARRAPQNKCPICPHPDRAEVEAGYSKGYSQSSILKWLHFRGYDTISRWALNTHLGSHNKQVVADV